MLFDIKQFEHFFNPSTLRKGLRLFEKGEVKGVEKRKVQEPEFKVSSNTVSIKKRGDKVLDYSCTCRHRSYCEHFCAVLFYYQQVDLGLHGKGTLSKKRKKGSGKGTSQIHKQRKEQEKLERFVTEQRNVIPRALAEDFLSDHAMLTLSDLYAAQINYVVHPFTLAEKLTEASTHQLAEELHTLGRRLSKGIKNSEEKFHWYSAIVKVFMPLFQWRFEGDETPVFAIYFKALEQLENYFNLGLSTDQKTEWLALTQKSLISNKGLHSEAFLFLLPRLLSFTKEQEHLLALDALLEKRSYKRSYSQVFDKLLIARLMLAERAYKLFKTKIPGSLSECKTERVIAKAELLFHSGKADKAFDLLAQHYTLVKESEKQFLTAYLDYVLQQAKNYKRPEVESAYLKEGFIHRLFINPAELERFLSLVPKDEQEEVLQDLFQEIKASSKGYYEDKLTLLLLRGNKLEELTRELTRQNNKFSLLHELALRQFPQYTPAFLDVYIRHLTGTLKQNAVYRHQLGVFGQAKKYLDLLPEQIVLELIRKLLDQVGKAGHFYRYIQELYDYPFLKEERNY